MAFRAHETPHAIQPKIQLQDPSLRWNWDQFLLILDLPGLSPLHKRFLVPLSPVCSPKDAQESIPGESILVFQPEGWNTSHRWHCLGVPPSQNPVCAGILGIPGVHPGRIPSWMLSPVVSNRAGRNEKKWDEDKMEISSPATDRAEGV